MKSKKSQSVKEKLPSCDINEKKLVDKWAKNLFVNYDRLKDELIALEKSLVQLGKADNSED